MTIEQIKTAYEQLKPILQNEDVKRYGSMIIKKGGKKLLGHIETVRNQNNALLTSSDSTNAISTQLSGNASDMVQHLLRNASGSSLGGLASLGWANLAISGVNLGVTVVGMAVLSKKMDKLSQEMSQMNRKMDVILSEMHQIKAMVSQLNENEIRKIYSEADRQIRRMKGYSLELSGEGYNDSLKREVKNQLIDSSSFLTDSISRYNDPTCNIALGLDVIMAHFYTFVSLLKAYISTIYLYNNGRIDNAMLDDTKDTLRLFCSKGMVKSIQSVYRQSAESFMSPQDLGLITSIYKGIMVEQVSEIKSQRKILELVDYNQYKRINEQLQENSGSGELAFIQYS
jgi:outer membrane murein-binding lipoprotein Lpp